MVLKILTHCYYSLTALISPCLVNTLPNKVAANLPNNIGRNPHVCSFASFLIVSLITFINNPDSSSYLTIFIISSISFFEIINVVVPDPKISF